MMTYYFKWRLSECFFCGVAGCCQVMLTTSSSVWLATVMEYFWEICPGHLFRLGSVYGWLLLCTLILWETQHLCMCVQDDNGEVDKLLDNMFLCVIESMLVLWYLERLNICVCVFRMTTERWTSCQMTRFSVWLNQRSCQTCHWRESLASKRWTFHSFCVFFQCFLSSSSFLCCTFFHFFWRCCFTASCWALWSVVWPGLVILRPSTEAWLSPFRRYNHYQLCTHLKTHSVVGET